MSKKIIWAMGIAAGALFLISGISIAQEKSFDKVYPEQSRRAQDKSFDKAQDKITLAMVKAKVDEAAKLLEAEGDAAFDTIRATKFGGGEGYLFVNDTEGFNLVHGDKPTLEKKYLLDLKDVNGVYFFVQFNDIAEKKGKGWVEYAWPKPGMKESFPKVAYVVLAKKGDKKYVVGAGMYGATLKDVKAQFPDDPVYEEK